MNESQAAAEDQSTKQKEQATPAVHDEDDSGQNTSPTMLSILSALQALSPVLLVGVREVSNIRGLSPNSKSLYPSILLKEKLLEVLETKEVALDGLLKALGLEEEASKHFKSVHEVMYNFEERYGQLSLPNWKIIFEETGCLEDFLGVIESFNEQRHFPGKVLKSKSEFESTIPRQQNALARGLTSPPRFPQTDRNKWPEWSLPPPEGHQREKRLSIYDDRDYGEQSRSAAVSTAKREDSFSCLADNSTLKASLTTDEMVPSPPEGSASGTVSGEMETPHNDIAANMKQSCFEEQDCSTLMASQEKKEDGHVSNNAALLVTGGPLLTSSVDFVACSSSSENLNSQQSRIPAEHDDIVGDVGLLEEMIKEIESLHLYETFMTEENDILLHNEAYLLQELRIQKDQHSAVCCENLTLRQEVQRLRTEKAGLLLHTQELQAQLNEKELEHRIVQETLRTENAELLEQKEELQDRLNEREFEIAEKNGLIQSILEENDRLRESVPVPIPEDDD